MLYSSFGLFSGIWIWYADVSEFCSILIGGVSTYATYEDGTECSETSAYKVQTPGTQPEVRKQKTTFCLLSNNDVLRGRDVTIHLRTSNELHNLVTGLIC